jgi:hypothetical protein
MAEAMNKTVGETIDVAGHRYRIVGIFESGIGWEELGGVVSLREAQAFAGRSRKVTLYLVRVKDPAQASAVVDEINRDIAGVHAALAGEFADTMPDMENANQFMGALSFMTILVGGVGVLNTMLMAVHERTREIGVLRAVGWPRKRVLGMIMKESVLLALLGGATGIVFALGLVWSLNRILMMSGLHLRAGSGMCSPGPSWSPFCSGWRAGSTPPTVPRAWLRSRHCATNDPTAGDARRRWEEAMKHRLLTMKVTAALALALAGCTAAGGDSTPTPVPETSFTSVVSATGQVVPDLWSSLSLPVGGVVRSLPLVEGDEVASGGLLLQLSGREQLEAALAAARLERIAAQQALDQVYAEEELARAQAQNEVALARDAVREAEYIYSVRQEGNRASEDTIDGARARLRVAREKMEDANRASTERTATMPGRGPMTCTRAPRPPTTPRWPTTTGSPGTRPTSSRGCSKGTSPWPRHAWLRPRRRGRT